MSNELIENKVYADFTPAQLEIMNYEELLTEVKKYAERYKGLVFDRDEKKGAEEARSELLSLHNALDEQRKRIKRVYNQPLSEFEGKIKELTAIINEPLNDIREGLKSIEEAERKEREDALNTLLESKCEEVGLTVDEVEQNHRWLNKTAWTSKLNPTAKLEAEIDNAVEQAVKENERKETEIRILTEFCKAQDIDSAGWVSQLEFKSAMEVIELINLERERKKKLEAEQEQKQKEHEEYLAKQQDALKEAEKFAETVDKREDTESKATSLLRVTGTVGQLSALNDFLISHGIEVEEVHDPSPTVSEPFVAEDDLPW